MIRNVPPKPIFEAGKSYRTRGGDYIATILFTGGPGRYSVLGDIDSKSADPSPQGWTVDGLWHVNHRTGHHLDLLPGAIEDEPAAVDPLCVLQGQIDTLNGAVAQLQLDAIKRNDREIAAALDIPMPHPPKRTIKGGWMNVYQRPVEDRRLNGAFVTVYDTKAEADDAACHGRIACIHIPDITDGEGL